MAKKGEVSRKFYYYDVELFDEENGTLKSIKNQKIRFLEIFHRVERI